MAEQTNRGIVGREAGRRGTRKPFVGPVDATTVKQIKGTAENNGGIRAPPTKAERVFSSNAGLGP